MDVQVCAGRTSMVNTCNKKVRCGALKRVLNRMAELDKFTVVPCGVLIRAVRERIN